MTDRDAQIEEHVLNLMDAASDAEMARLSETLDGLAAGMTLALFKAEFEAQASEDGVLDLGNVAIGLLMTAFHHPEWLAGIVQQVPGWEDCGDAAMIRYWLDSVPLSKLDSGPEETPCQ